MVALVAACRNGKGNDAMGRGGIMATKTGKARVRRVRKRPSLDGNRMGRGKTRNLRCCHR